MIKLNSLQMIFVLLLTSLMTACQSGAPQEAIDVAIQGIKSSVFCTGNSIGGGAHDCQDFIALRSARADLTNADKANGYDDRWCIQIDFLTNFASAQWASMSAIIGVAKLRGALTQNFGAEANSTTVDKTFDRCIAGNY